MHKESGWEYGYYSLCLWWVPIICYHTRWERPLLSTSSSRQKRKGESGSPYLTPLEQENSLSILPLIVMESFVEFQIIWIQLQNIEQEPNLLRTWSKNFQSKASTALAMSILTARFPWRDLGCNMLIVSEVRQIQSLIFLL